MDYKQIQDYKTIIDNEFNDIYANGPKLLKEPIHYIIKGGKRLRPILCMLCYESFDKKINSTVISTAVSIELLHILH